MRLPVKVSTVDVVSGPVVPWHVPVVVRQGRAVQLHVEGIDRVRRLGRSQVALLDFVVQASRVAVLGCRMTHLGVSSPGFCLRCAHCMTCLGTLQ